jgi:glycosyltransferase involved in cell wall biosynthesis
MKVLIINQHVSDSLGGSEMQCDLIACGLADRGHQVVYGAVGSKRKDHYPNDYSYLIEPLAVEKKGGLYAFLKKHKPDVVYWRFNKKHLLQSSLQTKTAKIPFVFAVSAATDTKKYRPFPGFSGPGFKRATRHIAGNIIGQLSCRWNYRAFRHVDAVTLLNSQYAGELAVQKQRVIWNSVSDKTEFHEWNRPYCVWVANIKSSKRPEAFIRLASLMAHRQTEIDFLMIGAIQDDTYRIALQTAENMPNFYYLGFQSPAKVNGLLAEAICLVHTCKPEGFGNNFIQAWMQGCPTITLEFDPDNLIQNERLGFLSGTVEQMVNDVERLIKDKKLRDEIGNRAHIFARANFHPDRMVTELEQFLTEVIDDYKC